MRIFYFIPEALSELRRFEYNYHRFISMSSAPAFILTVLMHK